jgi:hypothetical protein
MLERSMENNGYAIVDFENLAYLYEIQNIIKQSFPCFPTEIHAREMADYERLAMIKIARDKIIKNELVKKFFIENSNLFIKLLGPDVDIQSEIYLRASRPNIENDFIDWHRDTFYGNSMWELVCWFPVFPLEEGAGLVVVEGSHLEASSNIRVVGDDNSFRKEIKKGSLGNELGYLYERKTDDTISNLDESRIKLLTPKLGQGIIFFAHVIHRARNSSSASRVSIDLKVKNMFVPTYTREKYFQPLLRSSIVQCIEKMIEINTPNKSVVDFN